MLVSSLPFFRILFSCFVILLPFFFLLVTSSPLLPSLFFSPCLVFSCLILFRLPIIPSCLILSPLVLSTSLLFCSLISSLFFSILLSFLSFYSPLHPKKFAIRFLVQPYSIFSPASSTGSAAWISTAMVSFPCTSWSISLKNKSLKWRV